MATTFFDVVYGSVFNSSFTLFSRPSPGTANPTIFKDKIFNLAIDTSAAVPHWTAFATDANALYIGTDLGKIIRVDSAGVQINYVFDGPGDEGGEVMQLFKLGGRMHALLRTTTKDEVIGAFDANGQFDVIADIPTRKGSFGFPYSSESGGFTEIAGKSYFSTYLSFSTTGTVPQNVIYSLSSAGVLTKLSTLSGDGNVGISGSLTPDFTQLGTSTSIYFSGANATSGRELFKINSTTGAVSLAKDINAGSNFGHVNSSDPSELTALGSTIYFNAYNPTSGHELWKISSAGVVSLASDILSGSTSSNPESLTAFAGSVYFSAYNPTIGGGIELWRVKSNGIVELAKNIAVSGGSDPDNFVLFDLAPVS